MRYQSDAFIKADSTEWETVAPGMRRQIISYDDHLMLVRVQFEAGGVGSMHQHIHSQTSYVESGEFEVTIGDETRVLRTGDSFYAKPNIMHGAKALTDGVLLDIFSPIREDFMQAAGLTSAAVMAE